jgi:hypothetical protein
VLHYTYISKSRRVKKENGVLNFTRHDEFPLFSAAVRDTCSNTCEGGITRQTSVFAFQLAEYINPVLPTSGVTMGILGLAGLKWEKWAKWMVPLLILWILFAALTLIPPVLMKWGPA